MPFPKPSCGSISDASTALQKKGVGPQDSMYCLSLVPVPLLEITTLQSASQGVIANIWKVANYCFSR